MNKFFDLLAKVLLGLLLYALLWGYLTGLLEFYQYMPK